jgi:hypothetical protein
MTAPTLAGPSTYLRTTCCDAPVDQHLELAPMVMPVRCTRCGREAGAPGVEDVTDMIDKCSENGTGRRDFSG